MKLSVRREPSLVPEYSLTGDILSFLRCPQQYRRYNLGRLPPSKPVQLWFGEFIHGVMEESYRRHQTGQLQFPLELTSWPEFHSNIVEFVIGNLEARGMSAYRTQYHRPYHKSEGPFAPVDYGIAAERAFESVRTIGKDLFPLIKSAEVRLKGTRPLPTTNKHRSAYYQVTGVVDVVSTLSLDLLPRDNLLCRALTENRQVKETIVARKDEIDRAGGFEIIIDYKGMRRPPSMRNGQSSEPWQNYIWQLQTYAWLRERMPQAKPVVAGVLLYLNELVPSQVDLGQLHREVSGVREGDALYETDIPPGGADRDTILGFSGRRRHPRSELSLDYRLRRAVLVVPIDQRRVDESIARFDTRAGEIESAVKAETISGDVVKSWGVNPDPNTCTACDFNNICTSAAEPTKGEKV